MQPALQEVVRQRLERTAQALRKNNMEAYCLTGKEEVLPLLRQLIPAGASVGVGGSATLDECGVIEFLRGGAYQFLDRYAPGLSGAELGRLYRSCFSADCYLSSANAVTEAGEIFNVDGNGNRVAAIAFGPASVILVVGWNKIVPDLAAAEHRLQTIAAPANTKRLACKTPCAETGVCMHCKSPGRICCTYTVQRFSREKGRIKVLLVGEPLGF